MRLGVLEKNLLEQIQPRIRDVTPGVLIRAYQSGKMVVDLSVGETWAYYDLASLTKVVFTVEAFMFAFEKNLWNRETRVCDILSWYPHPQVKVASLLTHSSGLPWWRPIYQELDPSKTPEQRREQLKTILQNLPLEESEQSIYSDIGFLLAGFVLEKLYQKPLLDVWAEMKELFYDGTTLDFHPGHEPVHRKELYAPTEECPWRKRLLQGEVHDENAWALGGVSTHAGLFGSIDDAGWALWNFRSQYFGIGRSPIKIKTAKLFAHRARPEGHGDWAMGFMMPTPGSASCGVH
nr:serine hydrolase [Pseudobdellovibrionaceae bacterium]